MRRALAITLLIAFFAPFFLAFAAPLSALTRDPEASLPACCRSHSAHHCAMLHMHLASDSGAPVLTPAPCPFYPTPVTVPQIAAFTLAAAPHLFAEPLCAHTSPATIPRRAHLFTAPAHHTRGPPSLFA